MVKILLLAFLFSFSAMATDPLEVPISLHVGDQYDSYIEANVVVHNPNMTDVLPVVYDTLDNPYFKVQSTTCACNITGRQTCGIKIRVSGAPRTTSDYTETANLKVNGQSVVITATIKSITRVEDVDDLFLHLSTPSYAFGAVSTTTTQTVHIRNDLPLAVPVWYHLPQGVTVSYNECPTSLLSRSYCTLTLSLNPAATIDGAYNREVVVMTPANLLRIPVTATISGGLSSCLAAP